MQNIIELVGRPVVAQSTGVQLGTIHTALLKPTLSEVAALMIRPKSLRAFRSQCVQIEQVITIEPNCVRVAEEKSAYPAHIVDPSWIRHQSLFGWLVTDTVGRLLGTVRTITTDGQTNLQRLLVSGCDILSPFYPHCYVPLQAIVRIQLTDCPRVIIDVAYSKAIHHTMST